MRVLSILVFLGIIAFLYGFPKAEIPAKVVHKEGTDFSKMTDQDWKEKLSPTQYDVMREEGTEKPFSSPLNEEKREGTFVCSACGEELFKSQTKFDSGTGWPSFFEPIEGKIGSKTDYKLLMPRTEVHCAKCGGHLGHVFEDGPQPTGLRYCINGVSLNFKEDKGEN